MRARDFFDGDVHTSKPSTSKACKEEKRDGKERGQFDQYGKVDS